MALLVGAQPERRALFSLIYPADENSVLLTRPLLIFSTNVL